LIKRVYMQNELLPIPILLEMTGTGAEAKVFVNLEPSHFVDQAASDRITGDIRVLGTVRQLIPGGDEGYLSAERWLLDGYEYLIRQNLMTKIEPLVRQLAEDLELEDLPTDDVRSFITGPAVLGDAASRQTMRKAEIQSSRRPLVVMKIGPVVRPAR
jgi:hypothetical protein